MDNLFQNRLFLQALLGGGQATMAGEPMMSGVAPVMMQNIAAQSKHGLQADYMKRMQADRMQMIQQFLAGFPPGAKFSGDRDNFSMKFPTSSFKGDEEFDPLGRSESEGGTALGAVDPTKDVSGSVPKPATTTHAVLKDLLNPSASPLDVTGADLAGLTADDVSQALSGAMGVQGLRQKSLTDVIDTLHKGQLMRESEARIAAMGVSKPTPLDEPFVGGYTLRQYNTLTADTKEYVLAKEGAKLLGDEEFMSQREWESLESTEREKFVRAAMKDPKLMEAAKELTKTERPELRRPLVTWTTATRNLENRFGKRDPTGMWAVTPELQAAHDKAQEFLVEYKKMGMDPLEAVNKANKRARTWIVDVEKRFYEYIDHAQGIKDKARRREMIEKVQQAYLAQYGYMPSVRR